MLELISSLIKAAQDLLLGGEKALAPVPVKTSDRRR